MSRLEKYLKYKDSGVEWIGEVPEHWKLIKLGHFFKANKGSNAAKLTKEYCATIQGKYNVYSGQTENSGVMDSINIYEFDFDKQGCLFTTTVGAKAMTLSYLQEKFNLSQNCMIMFTNKNDILTKFFYYHLQPLFAYKRQLIPDHMQPSFRMEDFYQFKATLPPIEEQQKIANYLDKKIAQIDKAITLKEQLIEKLKERRQVLINDAVTKGLDPNVKMKDSGVEWIGEVPEGWEVLPGFRIYNENKTKNTGMIEEQVLSLSYGKIVIKPKEKLTGLVPESFETYQIVKPGDIIIRCMDLQNDQTSLRTGIARNDGIITSAYLNLNVIDNFNSEYLHYYLHVLDITKVLYKFGTGLRQNLSYWDFKRLPVLVPSIKEQEEIVKFIETQTRKIDTTIILQQKHIEKLKEYKATLIDSVVTGKAKIV